jgi:hypothetical protein
MKYKGNIIPMKIWENSPTIFIELATIATAVVVIMVLAIAFFSSRSSCYDPGGVE